jgi:hypothetical protein
VISDDHFIDAKNKTTKVLKFKRHNDFWNDPLTVSLGLRPPPRSIASIRNSGDGQENINGNEQPGISSNSSPNSARARQNHGRTIIPRSNTNGEMVFTEQEDFQQYIYETLESVARCMTDIDTNISVQRRNQHPPPFNANTTGFCLTTKN